MARSRHCIRKCSKVSEHNEQRIVDAYEDNEDFILLAVVLEINKTTAYSIIRRGSANNRHRGTCANQ